MAQTKFRTYRSGGQEYVTLGAVAEVLRRSPGTIRRWERLGWVPAPSHCLVKADWRAKRRLYLRSDVEALAVLARRYDVAYRNGPPPREFTDGVTALFGRHLRPLGQ